MSIKDVQRAVQQAFNRNPHLLDVSVSSSRGMVSLEGTVAHYQDKVDAETIATQTPGVRSVRNGIVVRTPVMEDPEIERKVEERLRFARADLGLTFPQIAVEAVKGVVYLTGPVKDSIERAVVLSLAGSTDGVLSVKDRLSVEPDLLADETTRTRVNKVIYSDPELSRSADIPIKASFANGTVTLMGSISDPQRKDSLLSRVRDVYGVSFVEDALVVRGQPSAIQSSLSRSMSPCGETSISRQEVAHAGH
ncbi:BON domain-containing protein [Terriglobus albidus]|uniref:BON domain-containing protein n=1 Tax=Terriglobus albidus TaxID=1592106 RepID=UPI0021E0866B|nr:BON domain-containing protein [Terriglobus albidus]